MIERHKLVLGALTVRVEEYEKMQGDTIAVMTLKDYIVLLCRDVEKLKSTNLSILFGTAEILEMLSINVSDNSEVLATNTIYVIRIDYVDVEFEAEINEEQLRVKYEAFFDYLEYIEGAMVDTSVQASLRDISIVG
ncbi:uncharacterized protein LOC107022146 [Solanum pennellii]|uniref:Uncharacterized protein LOC107022146 n=1 Tax=Solanum pennellii TaxID=28526 RepID=A0ABM1GZU4_SOLPN|nr:uncharacterized protein LOC107022146 [Solanum pennellii]